MKNLRHSIHYDFIKSPISKILMDAVSVCNGAGSGIEFFPISDYVIQSVFLKMTGFQEQKIKCIYWELATIDYEFRYEFTRNPLGECSSYDDKQKIYTCLINQIKKHKTNFNVTIDIKKTKIITDTFDEVKSIFENTNILTWGKRNYYQYEEFWKQIKDSDFAINEKTLFSDKKIKNDISLIQLYKNHLHKNRNRIAHNTLSYQQNLPTLIVLEKDDYKYENFFIWFSMLILIDKLLVELYNQYLISVDGE